MLAFQKGKIDTKQMTVLLTYGSLHFEPQNTSFEELEGSLSERTFRLLQGVSLPQGRGLITPAQPESQIQFSCHLSCSRHQSAPVLTSTDFF